MATYVKDALKATSGGSLGRTEALEAGNILTPPPQTQRWVLADPGQRCR